MLKAEKQKRETVTIKVKSEESDEECQKMTPLMTLYLILNWPEARRLPYEFTNKELRYIYYCIFYSSFVDL